MNVSDPPLNRSSVAVLWPISPGQYVRRGGGVDRIATSNPQHHTTLLERPRSQEFTHPTRADGQRLQIPEHEPTNQPLQEARCTRRGPDVESKRRGSLR